MSTLVLLSGGLDSTVLLSKMIHDSSPRQVGAISFWYGQKHEKELQAAAKVARHFNLLDHTIMRLPPDLFRGAGSALMDEIPMPHETYQELAHQQGPSPTVVPYRNGTFLSLATVYALENNYSEVAIAVHADDAAHWAYPDCSPEFTGSMAAAIWVGTYRAVRLISPFQWMMKKEVVKLGFEIGAPFGLSWSCYEGGAKPCRLCPTCVERIEAFRQNGADDPSL